MGGAQRHRNRARLWSSPSQEGDLLDRRRRAHARRRPRLADGKVRSRGGQHPRDQAGRRRQRHRLRDRCSVPDLFWALRNGGGNPESRPGFVFRLQPRHGHGRTDRPSKIDASAACALLSRDAVRQTAPDDPHGLWLPLTGSGLKLAAMVSVTQATERAERDLLVQELGLAIDGGVESDALPRDGRSSMPDTPTGSLNHRLSSFTRGLSDGLIDTMVGTLRVGAVTDDRDPARALPRCRDESE